MTLILDPTNTADNDGYNGLRTVLGLDVSQVTNADIDADPLFQDAEEFVVNVVPNAALARTGAMEGRNYPQRGRVIRALQFLSAYNFLYGGSDTITLQTSGGTRQVRSESETIGPVTTRTEYGEFGATTTESRTQGIDDRSQFFLDSAYAILKAINPNFEIPAHHNTAAGGSGNLPSPTAKATKSTLYG